MNRMFGFGGACARIATIARIARIAGIDFEILNFGNLGNSGVYGNGYFASGSGRTWNLITLLVVPLPVSMWNGARVLTVDHRPLPFQPVLASSMRPSIHFV